MALFPRARALSSLTRLSRALSPSYGPVMQARNRLEMGGVGWGKHFLIDFKSIKCVPY